MRFTAPKKYATPRWLIALLIFVPFIFPTKYSPKNDESNIHNKRLAAPIPIYQLHQVSQVTTRIDREGSIIPTPVNTPVPKVTPIPISHEFSGFIKQVLDGRTKVVRGIYVEGVMALHVVQQPDKEWTYVSGTLGNATEFQNASKNGVIGLLAHNYLSGQLFYNLKPGNLLGVVYGNGSVKYYRVTGAYQYQKVDPNNLSSNLIELSTGKTVTSGQVFDKFYSGKDHVTLQTCLEKNGLSTWGLYFVEADPVGPGA